MVRKARVLAGARFLRLSPKPRKVARQKPGDVIVYLPGTYRSGCSSCPPDFETTITMAGARLALGSVPVCSFKGVYGWTVSGRTLILKPIADKRCQVRETFFGGRWKR